MIRPPRLSEGARVALIAPAGPLPAGAVDRAIARVYKLGWTPVLGQSARQRNGYLAGSDALRAADLAAAFGSGQNDAIWCLRGGYGTMRLVAGLDLSPLVRRPRPLIGFSDITVLHLAAQKEKIVTFHGPNAATPTLPDFSLDHLLAAVRSPEPAGVLAFPASSPNRGRTLVDGNATGPLVGGNLSLLAATVGTPIQLSAAGCILFFEEVGEPIYRIDRLLSQLLLAGVLDGVRGIVVGGISDCPDADRSDLPTPEEVVMERLAPLGVPIASGFPFGHLPESWTLPLGIPARLDASAGTLEILEASVS